jgi:predicted PurR-regulated permease PerM
VSKPPPKLTAGPPQRSSLGPLAVWVVVVAGLYFAKEVLVPLALAVLITFLLAPIVTRLEKWRLGRVLSTVIVLLAVIGLVGGIGFVVANQFVDLAAKFPSYKQTLVHKVRMLRPAGDGTLGKARDALRDLGREVSNDVSESTASTTTDATASTSSIATTSTVGISTPSAAKRAAQVGAARVDNDPRTPPPGAPIPPYGTSQPEVAPIPVKIVEGLSSPWDAIRSVLGPLFSILGTAALVFLFVLFMLLQREDLRDRVIRLAGQNRVKVTTEALDEAGHRVSRYLLMQLIVNVTYGVPIAVGLYFIGLPNAMLWGVLATILRFIPYLGPWIAATVPIILSVAVFDGWSHTFFTLGLYLAVELLSNNFMEPLLYGHTTGVSPVAIIVSAVFWTWLWGGVGLLLATPVTVCLLVLSKYVPQAGFLNVLLGDQPVLSPEARVYHRLLADDQDDAMEIAEKHLETRTLVEVYDEILIPALGMAERDRHEGELPVEKQKLIWTGMSEMVEAFADRWDADEARRAEEAKGEAADATKRDEKSDAKLGTDE